MQSDSRNMLVCLVAMDQAATSDSLNSFHMEWLLSLAATQGCTSFEQMGSCAIFVNPIEVFWVWEIYLICALKILIYN